MPAPVLIDDFLELGYKSEILTRRVVESYREQLQKSGEQIDTPQQLADAMVRDGLLTHFQAENLLAGLVQLVEVNLDGPLVEDGALVAEFEEFVDQDWRWHGPTFRGATSPLPAVAGKSCRTARKSA